MDSRKSLPRPYSQLKPSRSKQLHKVLSDLKPITSHPASIYRARQLTAQGDLPKPKPKGIFVEREQLYEENLTLKQLYHSSEEETRKLKTRISQMQKDLEKQQDQNNYKSVNSDKSGQRLVSGLKTTLRDMTLQLEAKSKEIDHLKKSFKATRISELEELLSQYENECLRLRQFIDQLLGFEATAESKSGTIQEELGRYNYLITQKDQVIQELQQENAFLTAQLTKENYMPINKPSVVDIYEHEPIEEESSRQSSADKTTPNRQLFDEAEGSDLSVSTDVSSFIKKLNLFLKANDIDEESWLKQLDRMNIGIISYSTMLSAIQSSSMGIEEDEVHSFFHKFGENDQQVLLSVLVGELEKLYENNPIVEVNSYASRKKNKSNDEEQLSEHSNSSYGEDSMEESNRKTEYIEEKLSKWEDNDIEEAYSKNEFTEEDLDKDEENSGEKSNCKDDSVEKNNAKDDDSYIEDGS